MTLTEDTFASKSHGNMLEELIVHPKIQSLQEELERLRQESSRLYLKAEYMQFEERPVLLSLYEKHIGVHLLEEFQLKVRIRLAILETHLIQAYINRGESPDEAQIASRIKLEQEKFKIEIEQREADIKAANDYLNAPSYSKEETEELRGLYRLIAKALHPDLHPEHGSRERDLFLKAVSAYRIGDIHALRQIALALTDESIEDIPEADLPSLIEKAKESVQSFKNRIEQMDSQFPFIYRTQLQDENWIKEQQVEIKERIAEAKKELEQRTNYLMMLKLWKQDSLS